ALRRITLGTPSSSRMFWISSASAWLRPPATRASGPRVSSGRILRARSWAALRGSSALSSPACTSGMPQSRQKRSLRGCSRPHAGHASPAPSLDDDVLFPDPPLLDPPCAQRRLALQGHNQVQPVWIEGDVDV